MKPYPLSSYTSIVLCLILFLISACGAKSDQDTSEIASEPVATVGVTVLTMTHPFFLDLVAELKAEAARSNIEVVVVSSEFDVARQKDQMSDFIVQQMDAIILCPSDSKAIGTSIKEANEAGIPVFTADIAALVDDVDVVAHIGIDNYNGGVMAGETMVKALGGAGKVAIIDHPEVESVIQRTSGFIKALEEANANGSSIELVSRLPGSGSMDKSFKAAEDMLQAHPDLDLIFGINDETALGALAAIEKAGMAGQVQVIGFGGKIEAKKAVDEGKLYADVIAYPKQIGAWSIQAVVAYMNGEEVDAEQLIPTEMYLSPSAAQ
ncbi:MAG: substrate-binding domain-containing protein [Rhodothermales bacterium]